MKSMKDIKINFSVCILHALHVLHGKIKYSVLKFMTLTVTCFSASLYQTYEDSKRYYTVALI